MEQENNRKKYVGYIKPKIEKEHYVLGGLNVPFEVKQENGNWFHSLPLKEYQVKNNIETYGCTSFNTLAQIEAYMKRVFNLDVEYSDRFLGIVAGTKPPGNDPQVVFEAIRKHGLIPDSMLPFSDDIMSVEEYYSFKGGNEEACRAEGKKWLEKYEFFHEWVFNENQPEEEKWNNMKVALKSSPLSVCVYAWTKDDRNVYIAMGQPNHWTCMYNIEDVLKIFDTYEPVLKDVLQNIEYCKRIYIRPRIQATKKTNSLLSFIMSLIKKIWK